MLAAITQYIGVRFWWFYVAYFTAMMGEFVWWWTSQSGTAWVTLRAGTLVAVAISAAATRRRLVNRERLNRLDRALLTPRFVILAALGSLVFWLILDAMMGID
jgi:hypothetical protein